MARYKETPADFIMPLDMNGLKGRMLYLPPKNASKLDILFIYGHHSSLERWWGLVKYLNHYGAVTMPDLPGFGGMESFHKLGKKPTIDNLADYLASFLKLRYRRKKVVVVGLSFGFVIVTRMLQRYPELAKNVEMVISLSGFTHTDDFVFTSRRKFTYRVAATIFSYRLPALALRYICLNGPVLSVFVARNSTNQDQDSQRHVAQKEAEIWLWQHNDLRTHARVTAEFLALNNCQKSIDLPVWQVITNYDRYFDQHRVTQHLRVIFQTVNTAQSKQSKHGPNVVASEHEAAKIVPPRLRQALSQL